MGVGVVFGGLVWGGDLLYLSALDSLRVDVKALLKVGVLEEGHLNLSLLMGMGQFRNLQETVRLRVFEA